jgi:hypothetical protein
MFFIICLGGDWIGTTEKLKNGKWDPSVALPNGVGLVGHCLVQISTDETFMIGGIDVNFRVNNNVRNTKSLTFYKHTLYCNIGRDKESSLCVLGLFMRPDPKSKKNSVKSFVSFCAFGICVCKSCS